MKFVSICFAMLMAVQFTHCERAEVRQGQVDVLEDDATDAGDVEVDLAPPPPQGTIRLKVGPIGMQVVDRIQYAVVVRDKGGALLVESPELVSVAKDGSLDADVGCPPQPEGSLVDVHLVIASVEVGRPYVDGVDFYNPCAAEGDCTLATTCIDGEVSTLDFDLLVARRDGGGPAELGFEFGGVNCTFDVSCKEALLFVDGVRARSHVVGFTCLGPPDLDLSLWMNDLEVACDSETVILDASSPKGNQSQVGPVKMWANYRTEEASGGKDKRSWSIALALGPESRCTLRTAATGSTTFFAEGRTPEGIRYPHGLVEIAVRGDSCELTPTGVGMAFRYSPFAGEGVCFGNRFVASNDGATATATDTTCAN